MKPRRIEYSVVEMAWLEENRMMIISSYHAAFVAQFHRDDVSAANLHALRKRKGWKVGRAPGRFLGVNSMFSTDELAWLEANVQLPTQEYRDHFAEQFLRPEITVDQLSSLRKRRGWKTGRSGHFAKGAAPANKGKKMPFNAASAATQFKKGHVPANWKPVGHERICDGYVLINIEQPNPWTGGPRTYVMKHLHLWEQLHGPVPAGKCLKCLDGNRENSDPSNWQLVPRGVLPRLNGKIGRDFENAPPEIKETLLLLAQVEQAAWSVGREKKAPAKVGRKRKQEAA